MLTVPKTSRPTLAEGEYLSKDLVGLLVLNVDGREVGVVDEIIASPANDLMRIENALIPLVSQFVKEVNLENGTMTVDLIPGLFPGDEAEEVR
jgi:16S rRNA processing protein RimM